MIALLWIFSLLTVWINLIAWKACLDNKVQIWCPSFLCKEFPCLVLLWLLRLQVSLLSQLSCLSDLFQQILTDFIFVKKLCHLAVFRVSPQLETKNNRYTINLKHPLQTKMWLCWAQNTSFSTWLRVVKVLRHQHFRKTVFQINLISKNKIFKSFCSTKSK